MKLCALCGRQSRGFGYCHGLRWDRHPHYRFCSMACLMAGSAIAKRNHGMIDKTDMEIRAIREARRMGSNPHPATRAAYEGLTRKNANGILDWRRADAILATLDQADAAHARRSATASRTRSGSASMAAVTARTRR